MSEYFEEKDSMEVLCQGSIQTALEIMAERFMEENPREPFVLRTFYERGVIRTKEGSAVLDFAGLFPQARTGAMGVAAGELFCPRGKSSRFIFSCTGEALVFLNRKLLLHCTAAGQYEIQTELAAGKNRFILVCKKDEGKGFSCSLTNKMPQWEPCSYIMPFQERRGEAGFVYRLYDETETAGWNLEQFFLEAPLWGGQEAELSGRWYPQKPAESFPWKQGEVWYVWTKLAGREQDNHVLLEHLMCLEQEWKCIRETRVNSILLQETDQAVFEENCHLSWLLFTDAGTDSFIQNMQKALGSRLELPVPVHGECGEFLFLGPLDKKMETVMKGWEASEKDFLTVPFACEQNKIFWKTKYEHVVIRPFAESFLYGRWTYPLGVTLYGLLKTGEYYGNERILQYAADFIGQIVKADRYAIYDKEKYGFPGINQQLLWLDALDDCGSFGFCMLEFLLMAKRAGKNIGFEEDIRRIAGRIAVYMKEEQLRQSDGAFMRRDNSMWIDDMYMSVPFLIRYWEIFKEAWALEEACTQLLLYKKYFYLKPEGWKGTAHILSHMYKLEEKQVNGIPWSRGNGWVIFSLSELFRVLPGNAAMRKELEQFYCNLCEGYLALQDERGLWHQILDDKTTYTEISGTAMFICAFSRGIRYGIFQGELKERCENAVFCAWRGITENALDCRGNLYGVCQGSGWSYERAYYKNLTWNFNDTHGIGIVMLAGVETDLLRIR